MPTRYDILFICMIIVYVVIMVIRIYLMENSKRRRGS